MSDIDTSELRALLDQAADLPWRTGRTDGTVCHYVEPEFIARDLTGMVDWMGPADAALIAAAVNALPALLDAADERDAAIAAVERVTYLVERWEREAIERGPGDKVNTKGVAAMLRHAIEVTP